MSDVEQNLALMRGLYEAYSRKDPNVLINSMAEDGQFGFSSRKEDFKFSGLWRGRDGTRQALGLIAQQFEWLSYACRQLIADGDWVVALTGGKIRDRTSGRTVDIDLADVVRLRDGKIVEFVEYFDSAKIRDLIAAMPQASAKTKPAKTKSTQPKSKPKPKAKPAARKSGRRAAKAAKKPRKR